MPPLDGYLDHEVIQDVTDPGHVMAGIYPFTDGNVVDFDPIFAALMAASDGGSGILYRPDDYARPFLPMGRRLADQADEAASNGLKADAKDLYLRAAAVYRMARFSVARSSLGQEAWERGKAAYEQAGRRFDPPNRPVAIPFGQADLPDGDRPWRKARPSCSRRVAPHDARGSEPFALSFFATMALQAA